MPRIKPVFVVSLFAIAVFGICSLGTWSVFHNYALSSDEHMADFAAQLFLRGKLKQQIPALWQPMVRLIIPMHAAYFPSSHSWASTYLPVYAAVRALFMAAHLQWMTNAVFAGLSVVAMAGLSRKIWPDQPDKTVVAVSLLAASPQFLVMGMTGYAMPAHLALNLVWLWLYCQPNKRWFWLTPIVGVAALGLHQPFFHALFAAPFLFRLLLERRWKAVTWFGAVYLAGAICWFFWWRQFLPTFMAGGENNPFGVHQMTLLTQTIYLSLLVGWLALPLPLLALLGFGRIRKESTLLCDAALSCALTFGFYIFVRLDQGNGWGDRYFHGVVGCLILVAIAGWDSLCRRIGRSAATTFVTSGLIVSLLVQLPLRCCQAHNFVRPFAHTAKTFHQADVDLLVYDWRTAWYSCDLKRNDPFLEQRPIILSSFSISKAEVAVLERAFPRVLFVGQQELKALGMETGRNH